MEDLILISNLNDFIFCPVSIYFHKLYGNQDNLTYQSQYQINGTKAHEKVDNKKYSTRKSVKMALDVYSDEYKIVGKIDLYDEISKTLIERKKFVKKIYDGYIFQLYAQYYAMTEMGYEINHLEVRSLDDNKKYTVNSNEEIVLNISYELKSNMKKPLAIYYGEVYEDKTDGNSYYFYIK